MAPVSLEAAFFAMNSFELKMRGRSPALIGVTRTCFCAQDRDLESPALGLWELRQHVVENGLEQVGESGEAKLRLARCQALSLYWQEQRYGF